jgi:hypothetical protein
MKFQRLEYQFFAKGWRRQELEPTPEPEPEPERKLKPAPELELESGDNS